MDTLRATRFAAVVADIHKRWGSDALLPLSSMSSKDGCGLPTGFSTLDALLAGGGLPRGQLTEVLGDVSSGAMTLCFSALGHAQAVDAALRAVYVDQGRCFDADYAHRCGIDLTRLLIVRPASLDEAFDICGDLVVRYGAGVILIDTTLLTPMALQRAVASTPFRRLGALIRRSTCAVVCIARPRPGTRVSPVQLHATLCLHLERSRWIQRYGCVEGVETRVSVLKQSGGLGLRQTTLRLTLASVT